MQVYLINLDRRADRLDRSRKELSRRRLDFQRIPAVDKRDANRLSKSCSFHPHPDFSLTDGEVGCLLSHIKAWKEFLKTGDDYCLVLEDDVVASRSLRHFLERFDRACIEANTLRLETYLLPVCLERRAAGHIGDVALHGYQSLHWGAAAYILSRPFALELCTAETLPLMPVDHLLFNPASEFFDKQKTFQTVPALCVQGDRIPVKTDTAVYQSDLRDERDKKCMAFARQMTSRKQKPKTLLGKISREMTRIINQADHLLGFTPWKTRTRWTIVPFVEGLHYENASSPVPVSAGQQAMQSQVRALRFLEAKR